MVVRVLVPKKVVAAGMVKATAGRVAAEMMTSRARTALNAARAGIQRILQIAQTAAQPSQKVAVNSNLINLRKINSKATSREAIEPETIDLKGKPQKRVNFRINSEAKDPVMIGLANRISKKINQKDSIKSAPLRGNAQGRIAQGKVAGAGQVILTEVHAVSARARTGFMKSVHAQIGRVPTGQIEIKPAAVMARLMIVLPMMASQEARGNRFAVIAVRVAGATNGLLIKKQLKIAPNAQQMVASCA